MAKTKSDNKDNIQETSVKTKSKKSKVKDKPLESKVETLESKAEPLDDVKAVADCVVDVEIDLRSYNHSDVVNGYIRHKRSI